LSVETTKGGEARNARSDAMAEADGNRTRLSRATAHTGFEDRGTHQDPDASGGSVAARMPELPRQDGHAGPGG
jgi:hypothetical protein